MAEIGLKKNALFEVDEKQAVWQSLRDKYVVPPFSTLDSRAGYWQARKREWLALGIKSELGRGDDLTYNFGFFSVDAYERFKKGESEAETLKYATSIFDPVVVEIACKWYCPEGGSVFDPFAGGSVRGVVSGMLGHPYLGIDLSEAQVKANRLNEDEIDVASYGGVKPEWVADDSLNMDEHVKDGTFDFMLTCPPYFDLEVYSDDPRDISNMNPDAFANAYAEIMRKACRKVRDNRFAVVVIGDVRSKRDGTFLDFQGITNRAMAAEGFKPYNNLILLNSVGSASIRADLQFKGNRKNVKVHQYVLVYYKGTRAESRNCSNPHRPWGGPMPRQYHEKEFNRT